MSGLLLLADAAEHSRVSIGCQTDPVPADVSVSMHDYVRKDDFDLLVNCIHDYYQRVAQPDHEDEHSYAFAVPTSSGVDPSTLDADNDYLVSDVNFNGLLCEDGEANEMEPSTVDQSVFEEIVAETEEDNDGWEEMVASFSAQYLSGPCTNVIEVGQHDFDELITYLSHEENNEEISDANSAKKLENTSFKLKSRNKNCGKNKTTNLKSIDNRSSDSDELKCEWNHCELLCGNVETLVKHIEIDHIPSKKGSFSAPQTQKYCRWNGCKKTEPFSRRYMLLNHIATHFQLKPHVCTNCKQRFSTKERLTIHENRMHKLDADLARKFYFCSVCPHKFLSTADLCRHKKTHDNDRQLLMCDICVRSYYHLDALRKHIKLKHVQ